MVARLEALCLRRCQVMLADGVDIPTVAAILGHSQNSTTLNVYAHALPSKLADGVAAIEQAIRGASRSG